MSPLAAALLFVAVIAVSAEVGRRLGRPKDRETAGMVWGILLGPLGWIVIALSPDLRHPIEKGLRPCPACARLLRLDAISCRRCGAAVEPTTAADEWAREYERMGDESPPGR